MKNVKWSLMIAMGFLAGCGGAPVQKVDIEKPQFKVLDAAPGGREAWLDNPNMYAEKTGWDIQNYYYYSGEAQSADQRMACEKAQSDTIDDISRQVSVFVDSSIARASSDSVSSDSAGLSAASATSTDTSQLSSQLSKGVVGGIEKKKQYWEQRDYSEAGGARSIYYCWILSKVAKKDVESMMLRARDLKFRASPDLKAKVEGKMNSIDQDFTDFVKQKQ